MILGVTFVFSLGANVYLCRIRRTRKTGEKYSPKEIQVNASQNEQGLLKEKSSLMLLCKVNKLSSQFKQLQKNHLSYETAHILGTRSIVSY